MKFNRMISRVNLNVVLPVLLLASVGAHAEEKWKQSKGAFSASLIITDKPKAYSEAWKKDRTKLPTGLTISSTKKGKLVVALIFFKGCDTGRRKTCDAEVSFSVKTPNGKSYAKRDGLALWKSRPDSSRLMLSAANLALSFDPKDKTGKYKIIVNIRDNVSKKKLTLIQTISLEN